jgi:Zn-dependent peptidase ImmA (M78 family)
MLLNANHPVDRIAQSGAHELGHFVSTRRQTEVLTTREKFLSREERYANAFARCFIAPARIVRQRFAEITAGQSHLTRRHVILLASATGLSREGLVRRLEELSLVKGSFSSSASSTLRVCCAAISRQLSTSGQVG